MCPECTGLLLPLLLDRCHSDPACILNSAYPDRLQSQAESCLPPHTPQFQGLCAETSGCALWMPDHWMLGGWGQVLGRMEAGMA